MIHFDEDKQRIKLADLRQKEEEEFIKIAAGNRGLNYINLSQTPVDMDALRILPEAVAREVGVVIFSVLDKKIGVGAQSPDNEKTTKLIRELETKGYIPTVFMVSKASLEKAWARYKELSFATETKAGGFDISDERVVEVMKEVGTVEEIKKKINETLAENKNYRVTRVVEIIMAGALATEASDIHFEPEESAVRMRFRLDGVLNEIFTFDPPTYAYILSRIKIMSALKINVRTEAQDGRFSIGIGDIDIEVRTSILPGSYNESIVLRILNPKSIAVKMEDLGFEPRTLVVIEEQITKPNGMILTTGPTGSGKTTTLYAFLKKVHTPDVKIITIEDPVEYHLPGIVQTQTNPDKGYTFSSGLRAILRQDPDIIMVGEIRDGETAQIAINSALTGHLVFSTLHTNNAAGSFPRLLNLGINPKIVTSAINVALAQRLVRKLCEHCKKETLLEGNDKKMIEETINSIAVDDYKDLQKTKMWKSVGCEKCNNTGYKGRIGLYEAIIASPEIDKVVLQNPSEREIVNAAREQKLLNMTQDGIVKILKGITSLDELKRVIYIEN